MPAALQRKVDACVSRLLEQVPVWGRGFERLQRFGVEMNEQDARAILRRISDAAIELAFVRHDLSPEGYDPGDYETTQEAVDQWEKSKEEIKRDVLDCLTGDELGCNDPEDLNMDNCELLYLQAEWERLRK